MYFQDHDLHIRHLEGLQPPQLRYVASYLLDDLSEILKTGRDDSSMLASCLEPLERTCRYLTYRSHCDAEGELSIALAILRRFEGTLRRALSNEADPFGPLIVPYPALAIKYYAYVAERRTQQQERHRELHEVVDLLCETIDEDVFEDLFPDSDDYGYNGD